MLVGTAQFCEKFFHAKLYQNLGTHLEESEQAFFSYSVFPVMVVVLYTCRLLTELNFPFVSQDLLLKFMFQFSCLHRASMTIKHFIIQQMRNI